jgi:hypothetical protein
MSFGLSSCLDEDPVFTDNGSHSIVELVIPARTSSVPYPSLITTLDVADEYLLPIEINFTGVNGTPEDVVVEVAIDNSYLGVFDESKQTVALPTTSYELPSSNRVTIPKGQKRATYTIKLFPRTFDFSESYALGVRIVSTSAGVVSGNYSAGVYKIVAKNSYDGIYAIQPGSNIQRYSAPGVPTTGDALNGPLAGNLTLSTTGATTVEITGLRWGSGSTSGVAGIDNLRLTVDPVTNKVTMFALGNATLANWGDKPNTYDPATRTFTLNFNWNPAAASREVTLIIKYSSSR